VSAEELQTGVALLMGLAILILLAVACIDLECWFNIKD
jgi:hypothetical protein